MSNKTKTSTSYLKQRLVQLRGLLVVPALLASMTGAWLLASQPVYAQTQGDATQCYRQFNGATLPPVGSDRVQFESLNCEFSNGQGNCLFVGDENFGPVRCSPQANTRPTAVDAGINNLDECVDKADLSFDWGTDCVDAPGLINIVFGVLASLVGIAVVAGISWGGMLYATSNGNSAKAQQGITTIVNAVIGLLIFIFLFAITNFLVPGGIFRS